VPAGRSRRIGLPTLLDALTVGVACAVFLLLALYQLHLPGLYYDEAWDAVSTMHIVQGTPVELDRGAHISLFGRQWPLMLDDYQGIISTYLLVPFFLIGGISVTSIRAFPILSGVIAIVLCYFLARAWFGRGAARIAVLLFALSPSWIFWSRIGVYVVAEVVPFTLGALLAFTAWWRAPRGKNGLLYLGSFLMGLGLATKLLYIWPILAVLACYVLLHGRALWARRGQGLRALRPAWLRESGRAGLSQRRIAAVLALGVLFFCIGSFTFLAFNWQTHGTYLKIRGSATQTEYGTNNTTVMPNLWEEVDRFKVLLDGSYFWFQTAADHPGGPLPVYADVLAPLGFTLAAIGLLAAAIWLLPGKEPTAWPARRAVGGALLGFAPALLMGMAAFVRPSSRSPLLVAPAVLAVLLATGAAVLLVRAALRTPATWARPAGAILLAATLGGLATWLLTGQPDGLARGPFDLRLTDLTGLLFWISLAALLFLLGWSAPATRWQRPLVATVGYLAAVLGQSFPTLSGLWPTHLLVMLPLPQILIGAALTQVAGWAPRARAQASAAAIPRRPALRWRAVGVTLVVALMLGSALWSDYRYHRDLGITGGLFAFSDGIYTLNNYLLKAPDRPVVAAEWGIRRQLEILSQGRLDPEEIFQYGDNSDPQTLAAFDAALNHTLLDPNARYLFTAGDIGPYNRFAEFQRVLATRGQVPFLEHTSYMRDGRPIYQVYTARRAIR
jgi:4-amino-4-deoxy-L-arabinose transferase-like glycosyltransferase